MKNVTFLNDTTLEKLVGGDGGMPCIQMDGREFLGLNVNGQVVGAGSLAFALLTQGQAPFQVC